MTIDLLTFIVSFLYNFQLERGDISSESEPEEKNEGSGSDSEESDSDDGVSILTNTSVNHYFLVIYNDLISATED